MNFVKVLIPMYLRGSVHNEVRIKPGDTKGIENLSQYIIRNTFSLAKLSYVESTGTVIYRSGKRRLRE